MGKNHPDIAKYHYDLSKIKGICSVKWKNENFLAATKHKNAAFLPIFHEYFFAEFYFKN